MSPVLLLLVLFGFAAFLLAAKKGLFTRDRAGQGMHHGSEPSSRDGGAMTELNDRNDNLRAQSVRQRRPPRP